MNTGNTALHYAALFWPEDMVAWLLQFWAGVGLRNMAVELAVSNLSVRDKGERWAAAVYSTGASVA